MKVIKANNLNVNFNQEKKPLIAIWGFFDGWHIGHQALLKQMQELAKQYNYQTLVISFDVKPQSFLSNKTEPILLSKADREHFLSSQNIDYYCELKFTHELASKSAEEFINWLLANNVVAVVSAEDIHFGAKGQGNLATLQHSALKVFLSADVYDDRQQKVSSSYIKDLLVAKDIKHASKLLNTDGYIVTGTVVDGIKEGRTLGFPTANLALSDNYVVPGIAIYVSKTQVDDKWHQSMTVVLLRDNKLLVETYLLNFNQDIYGKTIKVKFLDYLRDSASFTDKETLINQIKNDLVNTIAYFKKSA